MHLLAPGPLWEFRHRPWLTRLLFENSWIRPYEPSSLKNPGYAYDVAATVAVN